MRDDHDDDDRSVIRSALEVDSLISEDPERPETSRRSHERERRTHGGQQYARTWIIVPNENGLRSWNFCEPLPG